ALVEWRRKTPLSYSARRGGRVAEGAPLLREYTVTPYRGFESLPLRHSPNSAYSLRRLFGPSCLFEPSGSTRGAQCAPTDEGPPPPPHPRLNMRGFERTNDSTERKIGDPHPRRMYR